MRRLPILLLTGVAAGLMLMPRVVAQATPDLVVESIDTAALTVETQTLAAGGSLQATIRNLGGASAGAFTVRAFEDRNRNGQYDAADDVVFGEATVAGVGALGSATVVMPIAGTQTFAWNLIHVEADATNAIAEADEANNIRHTGQSSTFTVVDGGLNPVLLWARETFTQQPSSRSVRSTPAVGDLDGDGYPEVVVSTYQYLRVLDGRTGAERFSVVDPNLRLNTNAGLTLGDVDGDGLPEIYTFDASCRAIVFNADGTLRWRAAETGHGSCWAAVSLADLDGDGSPEVVAGNHVYAQDGTWLWSATAARGGPFGSMPAVADIDLDGSLEVVMGSTAYRADGSVLFNRQSTYGEVYVAIGNLDDDPYAEIAFKQRIPARLVVLEHDGTTKWEVAWNGDNGGGAPTIADFDGDGAADIGVAGQRQYRTYRSDGSLIWANDIHDTSSGVTSATVFDFDNDGLAEVVFADEEYVYIWRGADGAELFKAPRGSGTGPESPIVADVNADGHADIVVPRDGWAGLSGVYTYGVAVYTGANRNWAATRRIWSQPSYSITHINDDLTIPATFTPNWLVPGLNNFRLNTFDPRTGTTPSSAPDLTASHLRRDDSAFPGRTYLTVRIGNGGGAAASRVSVTLRVDDQEVCTVQTATSLAPGAYEDVTCAWLNPAAGPRRVSATVDPDDEVGEGDEHNNTASALLLIGLGPGETVDSLTVRARDGGAELRWQPVPEAAGYNIYRRTDGGAYVLHRAAYVSAYASFVDAGLTNNVVHWYQVRWIDADGVESPLGTEASATPIPRAQRGDTAPTIMSVPVTRGRTDTAYSYQVVATDPDAGDVLTYAIASAPAGMTVASSTGLVSWQPGVPQAGPHRVLVTVTDTRGRVTSQAFTVFVETQFINSPPVITSTALTSARAGRAYAYGVAATDPDAGDLVSFVLDTAPAGMTIHPATGRITWMPGPADVGIHPVAVTARDLSGYSDTQAYQLSVGNPNNAPVITSTAPGSGLLGGTFSYGATATDPDAGDVLTWAIVTGPEGAMIDGGTGVLLYTPTTVGQVTFTIEVSDLLGAYARQTFDVAIGAVANTPPVFTSTPVTTAEVDTLYAYAVHAEDPDGDAVAYTLLAGPSGMTLAPGGVLYWSPGGGAGASVQVSVRAADPHGGAATQTFEIAVAPIDATPPTVTFTSPEPEVTVDGDVPIHGVVHDANLEEWWLEYQVSGGSSWTRLADGTSEIDGELAVFPASLLADRPYVLRLAARDRRQAISTQQRLVVAGGAVKFGAFTLDYTDLRVSAATMPIEVHRRYDSTRPYLNDFGTGWALGFSTIDLRLDGGYHAYVTLPSGREAAFAFNPESLGFAGVYRNRYTAGVGVYDTLENLDCPELMIGPGSVLCLSGGFTQYQPRRWRLTTADGRAYTIEDARITRVDDRNGEWTTIGFGGISTSSGRSVQFVRDGIGRITQMVDARGQGMRYAYDGLGRLHRVTDQAGRITTYDYLDDTHLVTTITGPDGCQALRQEFDATGRLVARIDATGSRTSYDHNLAARTLTTTYADGTTTSETFNASGQPVRFTDGEGHTISYTYDAEDRRILTELPGGRRLARTYDASGNPLTSSNGPAGTALVTAYAWTPENLLDRITYPNGDFETFEYDARGNLLRRRIVSASGTVAREYDYAYDDRGRLVAEASHRGNLTYAYDEYSNLVRIADGAGRLTHFSYDATGNIAIAHRGDGTTIEMSYDAYGLPTAYVAAGMVLNQQAWDDVGNMLAVSNGAGEVHGFTYDCGGTLVEVSDPVGNRTFYARDVHGLRTSMTDASNVTTQWSYDRNGRVTTRTSAAGDTVTHTWTPEGSEAARTTGLGTVSATFDAYGRLKTQTEPDRVYTHHYDARGRVTSIVTTGLAAVAGTHATTYDAAGAVTSVTDRFGYTVQYTYDLQGRRTSMTSPDGLVTTYTYDAGGVLTRITTGGAYADFTYDALGRRAVVAYSNGVRGEREWDAHGRLASLVWSGPTGVIRSWAYTYDAAGRPVSAARDDGSVSWSYDALGRLTSESVVAPTQGGGNRNWSWTYDAVGNRLDAGATFGADHRLLTHGSVAYTQTYDAAGNALRTGTSTNGWAVGYDIHNRLVSTPFGVWRYNAVGQRDQTTVSQARRYVYDGLNPLTIGNTTILHRYTYGPGVDDILLAHNGGAVRFYVTDHVGSVVAVTNEAGAVVQRRNYDAWGNNYHSTSVGSANLGQQNYNPFLYQAREWQVNVNLYDFRARAYAPSIGRFLQKDPDPGNSWLPATRHPYQFAFNRPTQFVDPLGEAAIMYTALIKLNPMAGFGGAVAGFGGGFTGVTLSYLGHFLEGHLADPGGDLSSKSAAALAAAVADIEAVMSTFKFSGPGSSVGSGIKKGVKLGKNAAAQWIAHAVP